MWHPWQDLPRPKQIVAGVFYDMPLFSLLDRRYALFLDRDRFYGGHLQSHFLPVQKAAALSEAASAPDMRTNAGQYGPFAT